MAAFAEGDILGVQVLDPVLLVVNDVPDLVVERRCVDFTLLEILPQAGLQGVLEERDLKLIAGSFITRSLLGRVSQELRVVIRPTDLANIDLNAVADDIDRLAGS
jgi:hypothetical protein